MKNYLKLLALAAIAITACSKETAQIEVSPSKDPLVLKAHYGQTKSTVTDAGRFGWSETDTISVYTRVVIGNRPSWGFEKYVLQSGAGTPDAEFFGAESTANVDKVAVLPSSVNPSLSGNALTLTLPDEYDYAAGETNVPMIAQVTDGKDTDLSFKHLGGLLKLTVNNVPMEASILYFIAPGKKITGDFTVADYTADGACIEVEDGTNNSVYINIDSSEEDMTFYIPLPVGEYPDGFIYAFFDSYGDMCSVPVVYEKAFTVERADLLLAPENDTWIIDNGYFMMARYDGPQQNEEVGWVEKISFLIADGVSYKADIYGPLTGFTPGDVDSSIASYIADAVAADESAEIYSQGRSVLYALEPGVYVAVMVQVDEDGNSLNRFSYAPFEVFDISGEPTEDYLKWVGTWSISGKDFYEVFTGSSDLDITFNGVTISDYIPNNSYTVAHWEGSDVEPSPIYDYDSVFGDYQPSFTAKFDVATGNLQFVAETITGFTASGTSYSLVFNDYWYYYDGEVIATATLSEDGNSAAITSENDCYSLGYYWFTSGASTASNWGYSFILKDGTNDYPVTMTKTSDATSAPAAPGVKQASVSVVKKAMTLSLTEGVSAPAAFKAAPAKVSKSDNGPRASKLQLYQELNADTASRKVLSGNLKK